VCVISLCTFFCSDMASKGIVVDMNEREKLYGENFDIWHRKIQYVLNEQEVFKTLSCTFYYVK
jgi:hypothetical protein